MLLVFKIKLNFYIFCLHSYKACLLIWVTLNENACISTGLTSSVANSIEVSVPRIS